MLLSIGHGFSSYPDPEQTTRVDAGKEALEQFKELKAIFWVPALRGTSGPVFQTGESERLIRGFDIPDGSATWLPSPVSESFPIAYRTGSGLPQWELGMDLASMARFSELLQQSRESGGPVLETLNAAEKNPRNARQLVLIVPVFGHGSEAEECHGFVVGMLKFPRQLNSVYTSPRLVGFDNLAGALLPRELKNTGSVSGQAEKSVVAGSLSGAGNFGNSSLYAGFFFTGLATLGVFAWGRTATLAVEQTKARSDMLSEALSRLESQTTRLRTAETALERHRDLLNSMPAFILARDVDQRVLKVNQKAARSIGKSAETIEGRTMTELGLRCQEPAKEDERTPNRNGGMLGSGRNVPQYPSGESIWMRAEEMPHKSEVDDSEVSVRDASREKATQAALRRRNRELLILTRIGSSLGTAMQSDHVASHIQMHMVYLLRAAAGVIATMQPSVDEELVLTCSWGFEQMEVDSFLSRLKQEGLPREPMEDLTFHFLRKAGMKVRRLRIPIVARGEVRGVIDLWGAKTDLDDEFSLQFFRTLGIVVGSALERARLFEQVQGGRKQLKDLSLQIMKIQEEERRHIGRELHDEVGQLLSALKLSLQMQNSTTAGMQIVDELLHRVRQMSLDLRPAMLDDLGLVAAVACLAERFRVPGGPVIELQQSGVADRRFSPKLEIAAFRMIQEALTNAIRHSRASRIIIRMWTDAAYLGVQVEDDGVGFDPEAALELGRSGGLSGMRERINLLGGELTMESKAGCGTRMCGELPITADSDPRLGNKV